MLAPGTMIAGKLRVDRVLGRGGMGTVIAATHVGLDRHVAVKIMHRELIHQPDVIARFMREARSCVRLHSDHVCKVLDIGTVDDLPYIEMELLDGNDLAQVIDQATLPVATATDYALQACVAVAEAHQLGIVHRDLKPSNLFVTQRLDGSALIKVLDFGIATAPADLEPSLTQTGTVLGSPAYMAPEQLRSARDADARSDIWSLGVILYEMVSGAIPFAAGTLTHLAVRVLTDAPDPLPDIDPRFVAIVMRCLDKEPTLRFQTVAELAGALAELGGERARDSAALAAHVSAKHAVPAERELVVPIVQVVPVVPIVPVMHDKRSCTTLGSASGSSPSERARRGGSWIVAVVGVLVFAGILGTVLAQPEGDGTPDVVKLDHPPPSPVPATSPVPDKPRDKPAAPHAREVKPVPAAPSVPRRAVTRDPDPIEDTEPDLATLRDALANQQWEAAISSAKRVIKLQPDNKEALKGLGKAECHLRMPRIARRTIGVFSRAVRTCGS